MEIGISDEELTDRVALVGGTAPLGITLAGVINQIRVVPRDYRQFFPVVVLIGQRTNTQRLGWAGGNWRGRIGDGTRRFLGQNRRRCRGGRVNGYWNRRYRIRRFAREIKQDSADYNGEDDRRCASHGA